MKKRFSCGTMLTLSWLDSSHAVGLDISQEERLVCEKKFQPIGSIEGKKESRRQDRRGGGECTHRGTQRTDSGVDIYASLLVSHTHIFLALHYSNQLRNN